MRTSAKVSSVAASLGICAAMALPATASATKLGCGAQYNLTAETKPRDCFLGWPNLSLAEAIGLRRIHWTSWGGQFATATARFRVKTNEPWTYVRVHASRRERARASDFSSSRELFYTRVRVSFPNGYVHTWRTPVVIVGD